LHTAWKEKRKIGGKGSGMITLEETKEKFLQGKEKHWFEKFPKRKKQNPG